jgi:hypothetical protein
MEGRSGGREIGRWEGQTIGKHCLCSWRRYEYHGRSVCRYFGRVIRRVLMVSGCEYSRYISTLALVFGACLTLSTNAQIDLPPIPEYPEPTVV